MAASLDAQHYQANSSIQKSLAFNLLKEHPIKTDDVILDIGCGDGAITDFMAEHAKSAYGIDSSAEMITLAQSVYNRKNLAFSQGQAEDSQGDQCYSLVTAFNVLHWVREHHKAFKSLYQALKPGGRFLFLMFPKESMYWQAFKTVLRQARWSEYYDSSIFTTLTTSEEIHTQLLNIGFETSFFETEERAAFYPDKFHFKQYVRGWLPCLASIPSAKHDAYLDEVFKTIASNFSSAEGYTIPFTQLNACLYKKRRLKIQHQPHYSSV